MSDPIRENRVAFLRRHVEAAGGPAAFARAHSGVDPTYVSQLLNGYRAFGERAARKMEKLCGWHPLEMDRQPSSGHYPVAPASAPKSEPSPNVAEVLRLAPPLSYDAQVLGQMFDMHDAASRRKVWKRAVEVLAISADLRLTYPVPPSEAPNAEDFGHPSKRAGYEGPRGTKQPRRR